jgi:hypothetical protein
MAQDTIIIDANNCVLFSYLKMDTADLAELLQNDEKSSQFGFNSLVMLLQHNELEVREPVIDLLLVQRFYDMLTLEILVALSASIYPDVKNFVNQALDSTSPG